VLVVVVVVVVVIHGSRNANGRRYAA